jgi:hypothetical protein
VSYGQTEIFAIMACLVGITLGIAFIVDKIQRRGKKSPAKPQTAKSANKFPAKKKK